MKFSLEWHRSGIRNREIHLREDEAALERRKKSVEASRVRLEFARAQLTEAERRGMTEYDPERLLVKRTKGDRA